MAQGMRWAHLAYGLCLPSKTFLFVRDLGSVNSLEQGRREGKCLRRGHYIYVYVCLYACMYICSFKFGLASGSF